MKETQNIVTDNKAVRTTGALFATEVDALLIDVDRAAEYGARKIIQQMSKLVRFESDPEFKYLVDGLNAYLKSLIVSGIKLMSSMPNDKLRGYGHHALTKFYFPTDLYSAMDVLGEVYYEQRVQRKVYYVVSEFEMMKESDAMQFSSRLYQFTKGSDVVLIQGVPHNDAGDMKAMSLSIVEDNNVEKLCTHLTDDMPDAEFMSILFPKLVDKDGKEVSSTRIPVTMTVGTVDELNYAVSTLK